MFRWTLLLFIGLFNPFSYALLSSLVLDPPLAVCQLFLFLLSHRTPNVAALLSTLLPLSRPFIPSIFAHYLDTERLHTTPRGLSPVGLLIITRFRPLFSHFPSPLVAYTVSNVPVSSYKYPSPALAKARQLWPNFSPFPASCVLGNCGPFSRLRYDSLPAKLATPFVTAEAYLLVATRITTGTYRPRPARGVLVSGVQLRFYFRLLFFRTLSRTVGLRCSFPRRLCLVSYHPPSLSVVQAAHAEPSPTLLSFSSLLFRLRFPLGNADLLWT